MKRRNLFCLLSSTLLFFSCENNKPATQTTYYFDLKSYFEKQAEELSRNNFKLKKSVSKDNETEEKLFEHPDWKEELKPFLECDINKPSWKNSFNIDSTEDSGTLCISYQAKDSSLKIKNINFCFERDSLTFIRIEKHTDNMYYDNYIVMNYFPLKAYSIKSKQKINFTKETSINIDGLLLH
jgi:hypothetical protein